MKKIRSTLLMLCAIVPLFSVAQTDLNLRLNHTFEGAYFQYGTVYQLDGYAVSFSRVQYYLSGWEITHDGGQTLALPDAYILASGNISDYALGQENITTLEGVTFDLGVDSLRNNMGTDNWPTGHPLAAQTPSMDWSWPDGYFFWTIDGKVDGDNDGIPDLDFQLHGMGDHLLTDVNGFNGLNLTGNTITIELFVNIADWLHDITLRYVGIAHDGLHDNSKVKENTNPETVFTLDNTLGEEELKPEKASIYADYTMPYAPTIYYDLLTDGNVSINVVNAAGQTVLHSEDQPAAGNFFVRKELPDGIYIITFTNAFESEKLRFVIKN